MEQDGQIYGCFRRMFTYNMSVCTPPPPKYHFVPFDVLYVAIACSCSSYEHEIFFSRVIFI